MTTLIKERLTIVFGGFLLLVSHDYPVDQLQLTGKFDFRRSKVLNTKFSTLFFIVWSSFFLEASAINIRQLLLLCVFLPDHTFLHILFFISVTVRIVLSPVMSYFGKHDHH